MAPSLVAAAESGGSHNILLPHTPDLVWGTLAFLVIAFVLMKLALPRFTAVLDERTRRIEEGLAMAEDAKEDKRNAELTAARIMQEAREEAATIRATAHDEAAAILAQARQEAAGEASRAMAAADRQIQSERQAAQISLRSDVGLLATSLAEKLVGEHLADAELSSRVIDRFLDTLENDASRRVPEETR